MFIPENNLMQYAADVYDFDLTSSSPRFDTFHLINLDDERGKKIKEFFDEYFSRKAERDSTELEEEFMEKLHAMHDEYLRGMLTVSCYECGIEGFDDFSDEPTDVCDDCRSGGND